jgi:hypothetical protein
MFTLLEATHGGNACRLKWKEGNHTTQHDSTELLPTSGKWSTRMSAPGNPDHKQYADIAPVMNLYAENYEGLLALIEEYKNDYELGGGNWPEPIVKCDGRAVARLSYNGRTWDPGKRWELGDEAIDISAF